MSRLGAWLLASFGAFVVFLMGAAGPETFMSATYFGGLSLLLHWLLNAKDKP